MNYEVEQKFRVKEFKDVESFLQGRGIKISLPITQSDKYFSHPSINFSLTDEALRIRDDGINNYITYKGPRIDPVTKTRRELEILLPNVGLTNDIADLLGNLGFDSALNITKVRRSAEINWQGFAIQIVLDKVERLGMFVELEIIAQKEQVEEAHQALASLAHQLNLTGNERASYFELIVNLGND